MKWAADGKENVFIIYKCDSGLAGSGDAISASLARGNRLRVCYFHGRSITAIAHTEMSSSDKIHRGIGGTT